MSTVTVAVAVMVTTTITNMVKAAGAVTAAAVAIDFRLMPVRRDLTAKNPECQARPVFFRAANNAISAERVDFTRLSSCYFRITLSCLSAQLGIFIT
ncbi:hypothetical protein [Symbiopectobacterium purcellii]|uniref:hypothetical protein n=1 Tax=Symbiopectobacterium purcellii TaxID=2871826 RepID=UPI003F8266CE